MALASLSLSLCLLTACEALPTTPDTCADRFVIPSGVVALEEHAAECVGKELDVPLRLQGREGALELVRRQPSYGRTMVRVDGSKLTLTACGQLIGVGPEVCSSEQLEVSGFVELGALPCDGCLAEFRHLWLTGTDTVLEGHNITGISGSLTDEFEFAVHSNGDIVVPAGRAEFSVSAKVDGDPTGGLATIEVPVLGHLDYDGGDFVLPVRLVAEAGEISGTLEGEIIDRPPRINVVGPTSYECGGPRTAISLDASSSRDPDGEPLTFAWVVDSSFTRIVGPRLEEELSLGSHVVELDVSDGATAQGARIDVEVVDTEPPRVVESRDICVFPPNHDFFRVTPETLSVMFEDECDASVDVDILDIVSSQPVDSTGDGNTAPDILPGVDAACVRAERQGHVLEGREYDVLFRATDSSGNSSTATATIRIAHDASSPECRPFTHGRFVEASDCPVGTPEDDNGTGASARNRTGCATAHDAGRSPFGLVLVGILLFASARRRRYRQSLRGSACVLIAILSVGCNAPVATDDRNATLEGNWWGSTQGGCDIFCENPTRSECHCSDCEAIALRRFASGTDVSAAILSCPSERTFSGLGSPSRQPYEATEDELTFPATRRSVSYRVEGRTLVISGQVLDAVEGAMSRALDQSLASEEWTDRRY